ncbi:MAG: hypothetical protein L0Z68_08675 [Gammaproteobacteria bacterium]|nr:hypothetical protein [Gammaproteobacteria bacterium]
MFVTVFWDTAIDGDVTSPQALKALVERGGIEGTDRPGYLFDLSDQSAPSGEYKYLTQGAMSVDELVLTFKLLTPEPDFLDRTEVLRMLRSARQKKYRQDVRQSLRLPSPFIHTRDVP